MLRNHFHLLVRIKPENVIMANSEIWAKQVKKPYKLLNAGKQFSDCFNSYTKSFNKVYSRTGSLFKERYRRIEVCNETKLLNLVGYIHTNAEHHRIVTNFADWPYSSYHDVLAYEPTMIKRDELLGIFNGREQFIKFHQNYLSSINDAEHWIE